MGDDFDLRDFLPYLLNQAAEEVGLAFQRVYKERYGMLRTEWRVLFHLGRYGEMTATEIGRRAKLHKTKVSRAVMALETRRFLLRKAAPDDRRREALSLTRAGLTAYRDLSAAARDHNRDLLSRFAPAERDVLVRALQALAALPDG